MFSNFFTDTPSIADSIPEPLKEDGDINPNATKIHDNVSKNVKVNVNVNTKDLPENNKSADIADSGVSSDTVTNSDDHVHELTEPSNGTGADSDGALESWGMVTRFNRHLYNNSLASVGLQLKPATLAVYSDLHQAATENIGNFMFRGLTGVVNVLGHVLNLFRTGLFDGWRDFKRSAPEPKRGRKAAEPEPEHQPEAEAPEVTEQPTDEPEPQPDAETPQPETSQEPKELTEQDIREAMHRTRQRIEGENYKEETDSELYKKFHRQLTAQFKQIAAFLGADKPSALPLEQRASFIRQCDELVVEGDTITTKVPF